MVVRAIGALDEVLWVDEVGELDAVYGVTHPLDGVTQLSRPELNGAVVQVAGYVEVHPFVPHHLYRLMRGDAGPGFLVPQAALNEHVPDRYVVCTLGRVMPEHPRFSSVAGLSPQVELPRLRVQTFVAPGDPRKKVPSPHRRYVATQLNIERVDKPREVLLRDERRVIDKDQGRKAHGKT